MERDFLGLNWKDSCEKVEASNIDSCNDMGFMEVAGCRYLEKFPTTFQFILPKAAEEDIQRHNMHNTLSSPASLPVFTGYAFDCNSKPPPDMPKKNFSMLRKFPFMDETPSLGTSNRYLATPVTGHPLEGISVVQQPSALGKFTLFYANALHANDDNSPHQAEDIVYLGQTGPSINATTKHVSEDFLSNQTGSPSVVSSPEHTAIAYTRGTVPQARRATLERFLQRRKDRLQKGMPYDSILKKSSACF